MGKRHKVSHRSLFETYWRILAYLRPYISLVITCIVLSFVISLCYFGSLGMIKPLGDILFGEGDEQLLKGLYQFGTWGATTAEFLKANVLYDKYRTLYVMMGLVVVMTIIKNILRYVQDFTGNYLTSRVCIDISNELFYKVKQLPASFFTMESESKLTAHFVNDIQVMGKGVRNVFTKAVREPLKAAASLVLALLIDWKLTLLAIGVFPLAAVFIKSLGKRVKRGTKKTLVQQGNLQSILQETFQGIKTVKCYQMENYLQRKFEKLNQKLLRYQMKVAAADVAANPMMETFITMIAMGVLMFSAHLVLQGEMSSGGFCAFYAALAAILDPVRKLATLYNRVSGSVGAGERVFALLDLPAETQDETDAVELKAIEKGIEFQNVCFSYRPNEPVLKNISFSVNRGECIALVGPSGVGKSTLMSLLTRFYEVKKGAILIDGMDIRKFTLKSLRKQISLVSQEAFVFHDTIMANIVCNEAKDIEQKTISAARAAHAHRFIEHLPQGYLTCYGEGNVDLSGGQKHRISLARAFFKEPSILILDEAMANLDAESESYIKEALEKITGKQTTFIIAHRFSTIEKADRILVINHEGKLEAFGPHEQVLVNSPTYSNLYQRQLITHSNSLE